MTLSKSKTLTSTDWDEEGLDDGVNLSLLPSAEWAVLLEWDSTQLGGSENVGHDVFDDVEGDFSFLDEPVPWANYDSRLGTSLYETDEDLANLPWEIRVDEWVASISETNDAQRQEITDLLLGFSKPFLRSLLPWLRGQQWSGQSILLFLQFRAYWDENPELWEASFWDHAPRLLAPDLESLQPLARESIRTRAAQEQSLTRGNN